MDFWRNFDNTGLDWIGETGGEIKMLKLFVRITVNYLLGPSDYVGSYGQGVGG